MAGVKRKGLGKRSIRLKQQNAAGLITEKTKSRKRHRVVDAERHMLHIKVYAENIHDTVVDSEVF